MKTHYLFNVWGTTILVPPFLLLFFLDPWNFTYTESVFMFIGTLFFIYCKSFVLFLPAALLWAGILHRVGSSGIGGQRKKAILMLCGVALILLTVRLTSLYFNNSYLEHYFIIPVCYSGVFLLSAAGFRLERNASAS